VHQLRGDLLRRRSAELGGDQLVAAHRVGQPQLGQHLGRRRHVAGPDGNAGGGGAAQLGQLALEDKPAQPHHADVGGYLLDLRQQVRGHEDRDSLGRDLADQRAHLAGALRVEAVGRLVQDDQVARGQQGRRDGQALLHAE
jgi:hypothetical protein